MRVLVIIYEFPPIGGGGGRAAYDVCRILASRGHQITVLTAHMHPLPLEEMREGIRIVRVRSLRTEAFRAGFMTMLSYIMAGLAVGLRLISASRPDVIHTHFAVPSGALAWALSFLTGIPYVLTVHLGDVPGGVPEKTGKWFRWIKPFTHPIWKRARKVLAVSEYSRQLALRQYEVQVDVIPNGADVALLAPPRIEINRPPRIVFAGRFVPQKNPLAIVQILAGLKDLDWCCAMLGDGPLLNEVRREVERHGIQGRFDFPGWVTPEDVLDWFSKSDILLMPSLAEGLPVTGVQALAKGLAVVVSRIGGFIDLVDDGQNGFLIPVEDHAQFEGRLRQLISDPLELARYRKKSLQKASAFDILQITKRYEDIFLDIVNGP